MNSKEPKPKRRWKRFLVPRYSLRTLLILVTVIAVFLGYLGSRMHEVREQQRVVAWVKEQGGRVIYFQLCKEWDSPHGPTWIRIIAGDGWDASGVRIDLRGTSVTDDDLAILRDIEKLTVLDISGTKVSDKGLKCIALCPDLRLVLFENSDITRNGFSKLRESRPSVRTASPNKSIRKVSQGNEEENQRKVEE